MGNLVELEFKRPPRNKRTQMETMLITPAELQKWKIPPFQRPLRVNDKVREIAVEIADNGGIVPGIVTLGVLDSGIDKGIYLLDGQHRLHGFTISGLSEGLVDVRIVHFETLGEMGEEFVELNSSIVRLRADDVLRGLEAGNDELSLIRRECAFVGYDQVRRNAATAVVSMSAVLRCWWAGQQETPATAMSAVAIANGISQQMAKDLCAFLRVAHEAWGREVEYHRLWLNLNLTISMWLYRMLVVETHRGVKRYLVLKPDQFKKCLMALSANSSYLDWLVGRNLNERDRGPCFNRIKAIFVRRLLEDGTTRPLLPAPPWETR